MLIRRGCLWALAVWLFASQAAAVGVAARVNRPHPLGAPVEFAANGVGTGALTFTWDFGDGDKSEPSESGTVTHVYEEPGHYPVIVVVKDETGAVRSDSFLQTVHRPLPARPPAASSTIVHHPRAGRVCNVNADNDTVSCLSTESLDLVFEVPVGKHPRTLAVAADDTLWVVNEHDASVSVLDGDGGSLGTIELPRASKPYGIVMSPRGDKAYVTLQAIGALAEIDLASRAVRTAPVGPWATGVAVDGEGERLFVTRLISDAEGAEVFEVQADSLEVVRTFSLAIDPGPDTEASARGVPNYLRAAVPSPDETFLWVPSKKDNILRGEARDGLPLTFETSVRSIVSLVDLEQNAEVLARRVDLNNRALGLSIAFSPLGDYAFVGLLGNNGVEVVDAYDGRVVAGAKGLGKAPDGLVLDDAGRLYVNSFLSRSVVVLDASPLLEAVSFALDVVTEVVVSTEETLTPEVLLGKQIFYDASDRRMSLDSYISCASCHLDAFEDGMVWDFTDRGEGLRNTTSLLGRRGAGQGRLHWTANFDELQDFEHDIRGPFGGEGFLSDEQFAEGSRSDPLGDSKAGLSPELDALAAYVGSLDRVNPSPFRAADGGLTPEGWRGLQIFRSAGCQECHGGPDFSDSPTGKLHDVGTLRPTSGQRLGDTLEGLDTPTLRGVWETAPYLHDGSAPTLLDVVGPRNSDDRHGATAGLSDVEREELVSYLLQIDNVPLEAEVEPVVEPTTDPTAQPASGARGGCSIAGGLGAGGPVSVAGAGLSGAGLSGAGLSGAHLSGALAGLFMLWGARRRRRRTSGAEARDR